jgi:hypothetical protein
MEEVGKRAPESSQSNTFPTPNLWNITSLIATVADKAELKWWKMLPVTATGRLCRGGRHRQPCAKMRNSASVWGKKLHFYDFRSWKFLDCLVYLSTPLDAIFRKRTISRSPSSHRPFWAWAVLKTRAPYLHGTHRTPSTYYILPFSGTNGQKSRLQFPSDSWRCFWKSQLTTSRQKRCDCGHEQRNLLHHSRRAKIQPFHLWIQVVCCLAFFLFKISFPYFFAISTSPRFLTLY